MNVWIHDLMNQNNPQDSLCRGKVETTLHFVHYKLLQDTSFLCIRIIDVKTFD